MSDGPTVQLALPARTKHLPQSANDFTAMSTARRDKNKLPLGVALILLLCLSLAVGSGDIEVGGTTLLGLLTLVTALGCAASAVRVPLKPTRSLPVTFFLAFLVLATLALVLGGMRPEGVQNFAVYLITFGGLAIGSAASERDIDRILHSVRAVAIILSAVYLVQLLVEGLPEDNSGWPMSARTFASAAVIFLCYPFTTGRKRGSQLAVEALWVCTLFGFIVMSLSRTAMVTAAVVLIARLSSLTGRFRLGVVVLAAAAVIPIGAVLINSVPAIQERFFSGDLSLQVAGVSVNAEGRADIWQVVQNDIDRAPALGHGLGAADNLVGRYFGAVAHPHNDYLRLLEDTGMVGLTLWLISILVLAASCLFLVVRDSGRYSSDLPLGGLCAIGTILAFSATDNVLIYPFVVGPAAILIGMSISRIREPDHSRVSLEP